MSQVRIPFFIYLASGGDVNAAANTEVEEGLAQELANLNKIKAKWVAAFINFELISNSGLTYREQQKVFGPNPTKTSTIRSTKNR